jgi:hypothetical protein
MSTLPPELMTPEQRRERATELEYEISREWLRFAVVEAVVLWVPLAALLLVGYALTGWIEDSMLPVVVGIWIAASIASVTYWLVVRIRPRQRELEGLQGGGG